MLPTPSTSHVNYDRVYEPAEDSYLLLDTLSASPETTFLHNHLPPSTPTPLVLEVGTGSGVVLAFLAANARHIFGRSDIATLGTDVNNYACKATTRTVNLAITGPKSGEAAVFCGTLDGDLTSPLRPNVVDVLIFNPPYVPTEALPDSNSAEEAVDRSNLSPNEAFERDSRLLALSYAGGIDGMETTNRLLEQLPVTLSDRGVAYILLCAQNRPEAVKDRIRLWPGGWSAETVGSSGKQAGWEKLSILRIWRP
ncbi:hypothetical protein LTR08_004580 [Meristemomyces frigidus]|nr:hypothetical protein LTR08_004580 [Meristemomyces frigidus]